MNYSTIILIAIGLAMDACAVSITNGAIRKDIKLKSALKIGFAFGLAQLTMPLIGWAAGIKFQHYIERFDHWIAFVLLSIIGAKMIYESIKSNDDCDLENNSQDTIDNKTLLLLAIATSIDALAVGVSFAFLKVSIIQSIIIIGLVTFVICFIGVLIGKKCGCFLKNRAETFGGIVLIIIGLKILIEHTVAA